MHKFSNFHHLALVRYLDGGVWPHRVVVLQLVDLSLVAHAAEVSHAIPAAEERGTVLVITRVAAGASWCWPLVVSQ